VLIAGFRILGGGELCFLGVSGLSIGLLLGYVSYIDGLLWGCTYIDCVLIGSRIAE
jgi:hypothetical protein